MLFKFMVCYFWHISSTISTSKLITFLVLLSSFPVLFCLCHVQVTIMKLFYILWKKLEFLKNSVRIQKQREHKCIHNKSHFYDSVQGLMLQNHLHSCFFKRVHECERLNSYYSSKFSRHFMKGSDDICVPWARLS